MCILVFFREIYILTCWDSSSFPANQYQQSINRICQHSNCIILNAGSTAVSMGTGTANCGVASFAVILLKCWYKMAIAVNFSPHFSKIKERSLDFIKVSSLEKMDPFKFREGLPLPLPPPHVPRLMEKAGPLVTRASNITHTYGCSCSTLPTQKQLAFLPDHLIERFKCCGRLRTREK